MSIVCQCRHCRRLVPPSNIQGRGLCRPCYKRKPIRQQYPPKVARRKGVPLGPCRHCGRKVSVYSLANYRGMCFVCRRSPELRAKYVGQMTDPRRTCDRCGTYTTRTLEVGPRFCRVCVDSARSLADHFTRDTAIVNAIRHAHPGPCPALQGTPERIAAYAARAARGLPIIARGDHHFNWRREKP